MRLKICDCCFSRKESLNNFSYLCHLDDIYDGGISGYSDSEGNSISGRQIGVELCNACYNKVVFESVKRLKLLQDDDKLKKLKEKLDSI